MRDCCFASHLLVCQRVWPRAPPQRGAAAMRSLRTQGAKTIRGVMYGYEFGSNLDKVSIDSLLHLPPNFCVVGFFHPGPSGFRGAGFLFVQCTLKVGVGKRRGSRSCFTFCHRLCHRCSTENQMKPELHESQDRSRVRRPEVGGVFGVVYVFPEVEGFL